MDTKLHAWWSHRQGLDRSLAGHSPAEVLARTGWARSIGGAAPYLTLFARAGLRRADVDAALAKLEIHELPSARGCTYVLPAADFPLGLAAGQPFSGDEVKVASKLGVTDKEIDKLRAAIVKALAAGPLDPDALKAKVGNAARSLGPEGVKKGLTTTMPVALGLLQSSGRIRRVPVNGRLDQQRYRYAAWNCPVEGTFADLAQRFFRWLGPATIAEFQTFSGLGVKAAKTAVEPLKLAAAGGLLPSRATAHSKKRCAGPKPSCATIWATPGPPVSIVRRAAPPGLKPCERRRGHERNGISRRPDRERARSGSGPSRAAGAVGCGDPRPRREQIDSGGPAIRN